MNNYIPQKTIVLIWLTVTALFSMDVKKTPRKYGHLFGVWHWHIIFIKFPALAAEDISIPINALPFSLPFITQIIILYLYVWFAGQNQYVIQTEIEG